LIYPCVLVRTEQDNDEIKSKNVSFICRRLSKGAVARRVKCMLQDF
jgi:hypothetical protein